MVGIGTQLGLAIIPGVINMPSLASGPQGSVCAGFEKTLDASIKVLEMARDAISIPTELLRELLDDIVGQAESAIGDIEDGLNDIAGAVSGSIPVIEGTDEWTDMFVACGLLNEAFAAQSPNTIATEMTNNVVRDMVSALDEQLQLLESLVEIPIAAAINTINKLLESLKVPDFLSKIDEILNCMDSICVGADFTDKFAYIDALLDEMYIDDNGFLQDDRLMSEAGISQAQKDIIIGAKADLLDTGDTALNAATAVIDEGVAAVKSLISAPARAADTVKSFFT